MKTKMMIDEGKMWVVHKAGKGKRKEEREEWEGESLKIPEWVVY
jgi:hypothetical protein